MCSEKMLCRINNYVFSKQFYELVFNNHINSYLLCVNLFTDILVHSGWIRLGTDSKRGGPVPVKTDPLPTLGKTKS